MTTTAIANQPSKQKSFSEFLNAEPIQRSIRNTLRERAQEFTASLIELSSSDKQLQSCNQGDLLKEALRAATINLPLSKSLGYAYIVVYNNSVKVKTPEGREVWQKVPTPTFILGYKGYIQLAQRSGLYRTINSGVVYEGELSKVDKLSGTITFDGYKTSDRIVGYFAYFELLNGFSKVLYMTTEEMARHAKKYSKGVSASTTIDDLLDAAQAEPSEKKVGWLGNFTAMAQKTVLRILISKYGPVSITMQKAIEADSAEQTVETTDERLPQQSEIITIPSSGEHVDAATGEIISQQSTTNESDNEDSQQNNTSEEPEY